jgi:hypothetical protein
MNYLDENNHKTKVKSLQQKTENLTHSVNFVTRIRNYSSTLIDNIFIDSTRLKSKLNSLKTEPEN